MRMIAIHAQTERKRLDRPVRCAEKHRRRARTRRLRGLIRPVPEACATEDAGWGEKCLSSGQNQADLHVSQHATWGMSGKMICCAHSWSMLSLCVRNW
jgi:hypothetical protein